MPAENKGTQTVVYLSLSESAIYYLHAFPLNVSTVLHLSFPFYVFFLMTFAL